MRPDNHAPPQWRRKLRIEKFCRLTVKISNLPPRPFWEALPDSEPSGPRLEACEARIFQEIRALELLAGCGVQAHRAYCRGQEGPEIKDF